MCEKVGIMNNVSSTFILLSVMEDPLLIVLYYRPIS